MRPIALASLLFFCEACRCGGGGPDAGSGRAVEVTRGRTLISGAGSSEVPFELDETTVSALVRDDAGQRVVYPTVTGPGTARFDDLPFGDYALEISGYHIVTGEGRVDLGIVSLGRASVAVTDGGTVLQADVTGLKPWAPLGDVLQVTSENAGYVALNAQSHVAAQPDAGETSAQLELDWMRACGTLRLGLAPLPDPDAGDVVTFTQLSSERVPDAGALELRTLVRAAVSALPVSDHAVTRVSLTFAPPATTERIDLDYRQSAFAALKTQVHPAATSISSSVVVTVAPYTAMYGAYTAAPDLAVLRPQQTTGDVRLAFDTGNPFHPAWPKYVSANYLVQVQYPFPDGGTSTVSTALFAQDLLANTQGRPLEPRISPPRALKVDGADALTRALISRRPVIRWEPPAIGTPTSYGITLYRFSRIGSGPVIAVSEEAFYETTGTELQLPFGEVEVGAEVVFGVTAFDSPGTDVRKAPFKGAFPIGAATALTAMMQVDAI
ncbi:MAG: hypothetical protein JNK82_40215 [Myxococcaceae bacterium]|nr:hypothetical protein [Myxococcaceae bacterium]